MPRKNKNRSPKKAINKNSVSELLLSIFKRKHKRPLQKKNIKTARSIITKLRNSKKPNGYLLGILRNVDPFVFEEILLTAFRDQGHKIKRNRAYTGDGGIDGKVKLKKNSKWHLIQAKRYSSAINNAHVNEFGLICKAHKLPGLFIHTGRTGQLSREALQKHQNITLISGKDLIKLIKN